MEGRLGSFGIALFALAAAVACSSGNSPSKDGGKEPTGAAHPAEGGTVDASAGTMPLRFFTGELDGTDARVAVVAGRAHARVYFCGGDATYMDLSRWIPGTFDVEGQFTPDRTAAMGWQVHATVGDGVVTGSLATGDGGSHAFQAASVDVRTIAGLYEGMSPCGQVGVIVSQAAPDEAPASQGACIGAASGSASIDIHQVNPVAPLVRNSDGTIAVEVAGTTEALTLTPAFVAD